MKNIDLGTFEFDSNKIEQQLAANTQEMQKFSAIIKITKDQIKEQSKQINVLESQIESERKAQERMRKEVEAGHRSQKSYNDEIAKSNAKIDELVSAQIEVGKAQANAIIQTNKNEQAVKDLRQENAELNKLMNAGRVELSHNESAYRNLNKELNALKTEAKNLGAEMVILEREGKQGTEEYQKLAVQFADTSRKADELNSQFKAIDKTVGDNQRTVGDYKDQIKGAFSEISSGVTMMASGNVTEGFNTVRSGIQGITKDSKAMMTAFISNPVGIILAVFAGIALGVREIWNYNSAAKELNQQVEALANTSGNLTDQLRINSQAIADTYGKDFSEAVKEQNELMQDFGLTAEQAFDLYNQGLAQGGALNNEFGDSIREYGPLFAQAGYNAEQFISILNAGIDLGVYNDKLPDAIKEAGLSLTEQTKATRDAMVNAFGAPFTDELLKRIQSGQTTVADALDEIADKAESANLNQQQLAQLTADVFKGAGEDAGGALKIFEAINLAQEIQKGNLTDLQQEITELANLNKELAQAKDDAFKSDSVMEFQKTVEVVWKNIQIAWYNAIEFVTKITMGSVNTLTVAFRTVRDVIKLIPTAFSTVMKGIIGDFNQLANIAKAVGSVITAALSFNPVNLSTAVDDLIGKVKGFQSQSKAAMQDLGKMGANILADNIKAVQTESKARIAAQKAENAASGGTGNVTGSVANAGGKVSAEAQKAADAQKKAAEEASKKAMEQMKAQADLASQLAKNELAEYIATNAAKLDSDKRLTSERLAEQQRYFDQLQQLRLSENAAEKEKALLGKTEEEKEQIKREYAIRELEINNDINAKKAELNKAYQDQQLEDGKLRRAIDFEQRLLELEERNATEFEKRRELEAQNYENERLQAEERYLNGEMVYADYLAKLELLERQSAEAKKQITEAETQARLSEYGNMFGGISQLLGKNTAAGKAAGIAQATINTYQGVSEVWKTPSTLPEPFATISKVVSTGTVLASGLGAVKKIAGVQTGFSDGGYTGDGGKYDPAGIVHKGEVVWSQEDVAAVGGAVFANAMRPTFKGYASGGIVGTPSNLSTVQRNISSGMDYDLMFSVMRDAVMEGAAVGTHSGSQSGITDLSENRKIAQNANF